MAADLPFVLVLLIAPLACLVITGLMGRRKEEYRRGWRR